jgi:alpha-L-rhamnosidase
MRLLLSLTFIFWNFVSQEIFATERPNFIFVLSDDQRWDTLGIAGNSAVRTPHLDNLAKKGTWFRQATAHIPQCCPSRATLLTGLPPHQHGFYSNQNQHPDVAKAEGFKQTLPEILGQHGYQTLLIGKWHLGQQPWNCGFSDVRQWLPGGSGAYKDLSLAQGNSRQLKPTQGFVNEIFAEDAISFLNSTQAKEKPFFIWLAPTEPHGPMAPNPERIEKLYAEAKEDELLPPGFLKSQAMKDESWVKYYQAVSHLDEQVGRIEETLQKQQLADNTVIVYLGDNGYMMGSRNWHGKVLPYEESVRVPLIIYAPKQQGHKGMSDACASSLDLPATFLSLAGISTPKEWTASRNLTPILEGSDAKTFEHSICEWVDNKSQQFGPMAYRVVRTSSHKLIAWEHSKRKDELYDLVNDPHEQNNLIDDAKMQSIQKQLQTYLVSWMQQTQDPAQGWKKDSEVTAHADWPTSRGKAKK